MIIKRQSFVAIGPKHHFQEDNFKFTNDEVNIELDNDNDNVINELFEIIDKTNVCSTGTGEWNYLEEVKRKNFINNLKNKNFVQLKNDFNNLFRNDIGYGYFSPSYDDCISPVSSIQSSDNINIVSQILCDIDTCSEFTDLVNFSELFSNRLIGNPYGLCFDNNVIHPDSPRHFYFAFKIKKLLGNKSNYSILEIGGGVGNLTRFLLKKISNLTYYGVDLMPACLTHYYYLRKHGYPVNIILDINDIKQGEINLIPFDESESILKLLKNIDLVFNSRSFCEMGLNTVNNYFDKINNYIKPNFIYHENSNYLLFPNSERHIEVLGSDFPIDSEEYELTQMNITPFSGGNGRYREFIYSLKNS